MFSRPVLGVNTAVYGDIPIEQAIAQIALLDVEGFVLKLNTGTFNLDKLNTHGLALFGLEWVDYGFGKLPDQIEEFLNQCQSLECQHLVIPNPIQFGPTSPEQANQFVADIQHLAKMAVSQNITIVVKVAHRFETSLLNTLNQAENFLDRVDQPNVKLEVGTFDLQMEEQDGAGQMGRLGERIAFLRMSDSNQGAIGEGNMKLGAYLWAIQELAHNPPILLDIKRSFTSPFSDSASVQSIQESLKQSRSWF